MFTDKTRECVKDKVTKTFKKKPELASLLTGMLELDPAVRLGGGKEKGLSVLLEHDWVKAIDQTQILSKTMKAQFLPDLVTPNFDSGAKDLDGAFGMEEKPKFSGDQTLFDKYKYNVAVGGARVPLTVNSHKKPKKKV